MNSEKAKATACDIVSVAGGALSSEKSEWVKSANQVVQGAIKGHFFEAFVKEWDFYKEKGKIKDDYSGSEQGQACFSEIMDCLDKETSDAERMKAMKAMFFVIAQEQRSNREDPLPIEYLKTVRKLSSKEILVMLAAYKIYKSQKFKSDDSSAHNWLSQIAQESGYKYGAVIETAEGKLIENRIIGERKHNDRSGIECSKTFRLTDFGIAVCDYITAYQSS